MKPLSRRRLLAALALVLTGTAWTAEARSRSLHVASRAEAIAAAHAAVLSPQGAAQSTPLPDLGEVGQGFGWAAWLEPTPFAEGDAIVFVARGVVGAQPGREIGRLLIEGTGGRIRAGADFRALGGEGVRIVLLVGSTLVADVPGEVEILLDGLGLTQVQMSLVHHAEPSSVFGAVVPAPAFDLLLGTEADIVAAGETYRASRIRFLARSGLPPPAAPSAILERIDVFTSLPALTVRNEGIGRGVVFAGVPVSPAQGVLGLDLDPEGNRIAAVHLGQTGPNRADLFSGRAGGVAVAWDPADLAAGGIGSAADLAAMGPNIAPVEERGLVEARRTEDGWHLSFRPPAGLPDIPPTIEVDGQAVGELAMPAVAAGSARAPGSATGALTEVRGPVSLFARAPEPPAGAMAFLTGVGDGAFYGFSWQRPVPITVAGAGTFVGREVRLVYPLPIGRLSFATVSGQGLPPLTLTGIAAPAEDGGGGPCVTTATTICLAAAGRFAVEATWRDPFGNTGDGIGERLTTDTGSFWFFDAANLELIVKVLDACTVNERFWVFAGGLTDVAVELTVTDTRTGARRVYENPLGQAFQPIQDTAAFATCRP